MRREVRVAALAVVGSAAAVAAAAAGVRWQAEGAGDDVHAGELVSAADHPRAYVGLGWKCLGGVRCVDVGSCALMRPSPYDETAAVRKECEFAIRDPGDVQHRSSRASRPHPYRCCP